MRLKSEVISKRRYLMKLRKEVQEIDEMALAEENDSDSDSEGRYRTGGSKRVTDDSGYGNSENSEDDEEEYDTDEYDNMSLEGVKVLVFFLPVSFALMMDRRPLIGSRKS